MATELRPSWLRRTPPRDQRLVSDRASSACLPGSGSKHLREFSEAAPRHQRGVSCVPALVLPTVQQSTDVHGARPRGTSSRPSQRLNLTISPPTSQCATEVRGTPCSFRLIRPVIPPVLRGTGGLAQASLGGQGLGARSTRRREATLSPPSLTQRPDKNLWVPPEVMPSAWWAVLQRAGKAPRQAGKGAGRGRELAHQRTPPSCDVLLPTSKGERKSELKASTQLSTAVLFFVPRSTSPPVH